MFKINNKNKDELSINTVNMLNQEELYYMKEYKNKLLSIDIKNFNYIIFEEDINNMVYDEFEKYFKTDFIEILEFYNQYLNIDIDAIAYNKTDCLVHNKLILKNIIKFLSTTLPYTYLREFLHNQDVDGFHDTIELLDKINTKEKIIEMIEKQYSEQDNFYTLMNKVGENITNKSKKIKFQDSMQILEIKIEEKKKIINYYKSIIQNSGEESFTNLLKQYIKQDMLNII